MAGAHRIRDRLGGSGGASLRPLLRMPTAEVVLLALRWQAFGIACLACHVVLVRDVGVVCFPIILACLAVVAAHSSLAGLVMYAQILLYQNVLISVFSVGMARSDYTILSGTSFGGALVLAALPAWRSLRFGHPFVSAVPGVSRVALATGVAVLVAGTYAALGAAVAGATPAAIGFRNATAMLLAAIVGLTVGTTWDYRGVAVCLAVSLLPGLALASLEVADPGWYLDLVNATDFSNVKYLTSETPRYYTSEDVIGRMTQLPFNTELLSAFIPGKSYRLGGPNMHAISYGYVVAVAGLMLLSLGWWALVPPLLLLSFLTGVKGAAILFFASVLLYAAWSLTRRLWVLLGAGLLFTAAYVTFGILSGLKTGDFHVIGFLGGVKGFLKNPVGHGLGVGGNLSVGSLSLAQWQDYQRNGADIGLESAVGVLLYQMGVGAIAIAAAVAALLRAAPFGAGGRARPTDLLFIGLCISLVNGIFQEEAYSPYAAGLLCLLCGVLVSNGRRPSVVSGRHR